MIKRKEIASHRSCLNRAALDEPVFVLRANDYNAPAVVRVWATAYQSTKIAIHGRLTTMQMAKHSEALAISNEMEVWKRERADIKPDAFTVTDTNYFKVVETCNYDGDYPNEKFVEPLPARMSEAQASRICDAIMTCVPDKMHPRYYRVVREGYALQPGFTP